MSGYMVRLDAPYGGGVQSLFVNPKLVASICPYPPIGERPTTTLRMTYGVYHRVFGTPDEVAAALGVATALEALELSNK